LVDGNTQIGKSEGQDILCHVCAKKSHVKQPELEVPHSGGLICARCLLDMRDGKIPACQCSGEFCTYVRRLGLNTQLLVISGKSH
jgi:hypothetical protein